jgi:hypothetical protein
VDAARRRRRTGGTSRGSHVLALALSSHNTGFTKPNAPPVSISSPLASSSRGAVADARASAHRRRSTITARPHERISGQFLPTADSPRLPTSGAHVNSVARAQVRPNSVVRPPRAPWPPLGRRCGRDPSAITSSPISTFRAYFSLANPLLALPFPVVAGNAAGRHRRMTTPSRTSASRGHARSRPSLFAGLNGLGPKPKPGRRACYPRARARAERPYPAGGSRWAGPLAIRKMIFRFSFII